ncbi:PAS domain S-box protein [Candidatus Venteria ishoeyi]|uniref:PAS domain S-box protein n=1 Tax=Candidatus Venteria ishoeyi TaxID=1899563 RepID=UPI0025A52652|nr:PAS domain S-box protein [Candidatus Venteria ishoeyi]MDM8545718.1 PAS domain S-box protein [Candidatus Venteria ishoeyi]
MRWLLIFLLLESLAVGFLYKVTHTNQQQYLQQHVTMLQTAYTTVVNSFRLTTETLYNETINQPDVIALFRLGAKSKDAKRKRFRGRLYRRLYPTYKRLRARNLKQLHFHLANGDSYLRFHRPELFGDNLFDVRPSLRIVNQEHRPVFGFEGGRIYSGFRYVFPVFDDNTHLGSVETSLSFLAIEDELSKVVPESKFSLLLQKDSVLSLAFKSEQSIYAPSRLHPDYYYEDLGISDLGRPTPLDLLVQTLNEQLAKRPEVAEQMQMQKAFGADVKYQGKEYAATLIPIKNISGQQAAYLISYGPAPLLKTFIQELHLQLLAVTMILGLMVWFMWRNEKSRHALRESQIMFSGIFNNAPIGISLLDYQGYYIQANPLFLELFGYSWEEMKPKRCLDINHPDYIEISKEALESIRSGQNKQWNMDKRFIRKDGSVFWGNHWLSSLLDDEGNCIGLICIVSDLTERKAAERTLRKLSRVVEQSHNTITITNLDGYIEFVNPAFTRTSGYSAEEAIGANSGLLKSGLQPTEFYANLWETLKRGEIWNGEFLNKRKDGSLYWESATISTLINEEGKPSQYLEVKEDITERKEAEMELQEKNFELLRLNQEKNEFLGIAAHDLKNPLSAIKGLAEEIQEDYKDMDADEVIQDAGKIRMAAQRMFMLITNLLDVNIIESGKLNIEPALYHIQELVEAVVDDYQQRAAQKNIQLRYDNQVGDCLVKLDGEIFQQVMDNLVSNAIKYSPQDTVTTLRLSRKNGFVCCEIQDQGPGFSAEDLNKMFGKFVRLSAKPTGNEHSTGLGLFIVKKMVEAMHGKVRCESVAGQGANFIVEFPA